MEAGARLGQYLLDDLLGAGGMGTVFRATGPDGPVAVKVLHPALVEGGDAVARFRRELEVGTRVRHPNVVRTLGGGECDGAHYLVMELVQGQTLADLQAELGRVPEELCRHIGHEAAQGLAAIHAAGAVHRDVKPENVLITPDHVVKIMDLGIARSVQDSLRISQTGAFVGSLCYASPEQFRDGGKGLDGRVDLHALGLVLYELACGVRPNDAEELPAVVHNVLHVAPARLGTLNPQISPFFEELVHCLMEKDRERRFASAETLAVALEQATESAWWRDRAAELQRATRRPLRRIRIPRETSLHGRDDELRRLEQLYDRAREGDGGVLLLEGEAGIGKSRLVDELVARLDARGEDVCFLAGSYPPAGAASAWSAWTDAYAEHLSGGGAVAHLPDRPALARSFDAFLRNETPPPGAPPLTPEALHACFVDVTRSLASERPVIVLIDDLHFAPDAGRALLAALALGVAGRRVLLVAAFRPGVPQEWSAQLLGLPHAARIELARLAESDLLELLHDSMRSRPLVEQIGRRIAAAADGNPLFAFEVLRELRNAGLLSRRPDGSWVATRRIDEVRIPGTVRDLLSAQLAGLGDDELELLQVAACIGFTFDPTLAGEVCGLARIPALRAFGRVERHRRVVRSVGRDYVFAHHQLLEVLYEQLNDRLREELHAALGETLLARLGWESRAPDATDGASAAVVCRHLIRGARVDRAAPFLEAALVHLERTYQNVLCIELIDGVLADDTAADGATTVRRLLRKARRLEMLGRAEDERRVVDEAAALAKTCGDDELLARALTQSGWRSFLAGDLERARVLLTRAVDLARRAGAVAAEAGATSNLGATLCVSGSYEEGLARFRRSVELARAAGDRSQEGMSLGNVGSALWRLDRYEESRATFEQALAIHRESGNVRAEANDTNGLGNALFSLGRHQEACDAFRRFLEITERIGDRPTSCTGMGNLGNALVELGHLAEAFDWYDRQLALSREIGRRESEARAHLGRGERLVEVGDPENGREEILRALSIARQMGAPLLEASCLDVLGRIDADAGDVPSALARFDDAHALATRIEWRSGLFNVALHRAEALRRIGAPGAVPALRTARDLARDLGSKAEEVLALALLAAATANGLDPDDASEPPVSAAFARAARDAAGPHLGLPARIEIAYHLHLADGDLTDLTTAATLLGELADHAPPGRRRSLLEGVPLHRAIVAAANAHSIPVPTASASPPDPTPTP